MGIINQNLFAKGACDQLKYPAVKDGGDLGCRLPGRELRGLYAAFANSISQCDLRWSAREYTFNTDMCQRLGLACNNSVGLLRGFRYGV